MGCDILGVSSWVSQAGVPRLGAVGGVVTRGCMPSSRPAHLLFLFHNRGEQGWGTEGIGGRPQNCTIR